MNVPAWLSDETKYLVYRAMSWLGPALPTRAGRAVYEGAGRLAYHLLPGARATVAAARSAAHGSNRFTTPWDPVRGDGGGAQSFERLTIGNRRCLPAI